MGKIWIPGGGGGADLDLVTATAADVRSGKVIVDQDGNPLTGTIESMAGGTKTPTTAKQTISCNGKYMTSDIVIPAFTAPSASIIKKGQTVTIYGTTVTGTFEGYVTSPLYLYNKGTWSNLTETGLTVTSSYGSVTSEDSDLKLVFGNTTDQRYCFFRTKEKVSFNNYNYLKAYFYNQSSYSTMYLGYSTNASVTALSSLSKSVSQTSESNSQKIIDISSVTGSYYIYFGAYASNMKSVYGVVTQLYLANS